MGYRTVYTNWLPAGLLLIAAVGCGQKGPELAEVQGNVTLDGRPIQGAVVTFRPLSETSTTSYGATDASGSYRLMFTRSTYGAMLGQYDVVINTPHFSKQELQELKNAGEKVPEEIVRIPKRYTQPGALAAEVKSGQNTVDFALLSK